jgi:hypothetical protein
MANTRAREARHESLTDRYMDRVRATNTDPVVTERLRALDREEDSARPAERQARGAHESR